MARLILLASLLLPAAMSWAQSSAPSGLRAERERLARLERAYTSAKQAHLRTPLDAARRRAFVDATVRLGTATMMSPALPPRQKYPRALALYREALRLDPNHKEARQNKRMIEDIYRQMGKPIPGA